jgi:hypothetical protein
MMINVGSLVTNITPDNASYLRGLRYETPICSEQIVQK